MDRIEGEIRTILSVGGIILRCAKTLFIRNYLQEKVI